MHRLSEPAEHPQLNGAHSLTQKPQIFIGPNFSR